MLTDHIEGDSQIGELLKNEGSHSQGIECNRNQGTGDLLTSGGTSTSRSGAEGWSSRAISRSQSVVFPITEKTTTKRCPASWYCLTLDDT
ncbi:MAG: hypothetical protein NTX88_12355 [Candidatus Atribacteria bacterium]|nr:hypothetical protein [Candidatus Atribacteria bacterium]